MKPGAYLYLIEYIKADGTPVTRVAVCYLTAGENQMVLEALVRASERIRKPAQVRVFTRCGHVLGAIRNHWPQQWKENGWKNAKGAEVKNAKLWERLLYGVEPHTFTATEEDHSYRDWMILQLDRKIKEKESEDKREDTSGNGTHHNRENGGRRKMEENENAL